jgi:hypothetical protein
VILASQSNFFATLPFLHPFEDGANRLIPKGLRPFLSKNTPNRPFLAQEAQKKSYFIFLHF